MDYRRQAKAPTGSRLCSKNLFLTLPFANFIHNTNAMIGRQKCPPAANFAKKTFFDPAVLQSFL